MNRRVAIVLACTLLALAATGIVLPVREEGWIYGLADELGPIRTRPRATFDSTGGWTNFRFRGMWEPSDEGAGLTFTKLGVASGHEDVVMLQILLLEWLAILAVGAAFAWRVRTRRPSDLQPTAYGLQPG